MRHDAQFKVIISVAFLFTFERTVNESWNQL